MRKIMVCLLALLSLPSLALEGIRFDKDDWELICDNTGTCRTISYASLSTSNDGLPRDVIFYFERKAGSDTKIIGKAYIDENTLYFWAIPKLFINGNDLGEVKRKDIFGWDLEFTEEQASKIVENLLSGNKDISLCFVKEDGKTFLPDMVYVPMGGITEVMLKMDEFQQRLDTASALVRKGNSLKKVLEPQPIPKIQEKPFPANYKLVETDDEFSVNGTLINKSFLVKDDKGNIIWQSGEDEFHTFNDGVLKTLNGYQYLEYKEAVWNGHFFEVTYHLISPKYPNMKIAWDWVLPIHIAEIIPLNAKKESTEPQNAQ